MTMTDLRFGTYLPRWSERTTPDAFHRIATAAEAAGFDWIGRGDHVAFPEGTEEVSGWSARTNAYDVFSVLSSVAAVTDEIRLGTKIVVVPYRHPVTLAKLALSLDSLSDGRLEFGVAAGWHEREFEVLDVPFDERGSRTDEFLELFERVQREDIVAFDGPHHEFRATGFYPRPVQDPIPIIVGGHSGPAFRRVAQFGDGWGYTAEPDGIRAARERITTAWRDFDRSGEPEIVAGQDAYVGEPADADVDGPLVGDVDAILEGIGDYVDAGVTRLDVKFGSTTADVDEQVAQIERFGDEVIAAVDDRGET